MRIFALTIICLGLNCLYGQSPFKIEQELLTQFRKIQYFHTAEQHDSLQQANQSFHKSLLAYASTVHATITFDFNELVKEGLIIKTSEDGLFRIYSWDTWMGGTAHDFDGIYQYKTGNKIFARAFHKEEGDMGRWYSRIYSLRSDDKMYYIGLYHEIFSSKDSYQGIKVFSIEEDNLNDTVHLIKTKTGIRNELGFDYDFLSVAGRPERPVKLIYYDDDQQQLHLSVVLEDGKVTRRFISYQFTGKYFEKIKE